MYALKKFVRSLIPAPLLSLYHLSLAYVGALVYGFPSRKMIVIGVTGTDGKSSTIEYINAIFEHAGYKTAVSNSIRVKIDTKTHPSAGRSMPGRFFIQRFLSHARAAGCTVAVIEMTSEGVSQHRHRAIALDALVFINLSPEHIESHGSLEAYANAKFEIGLALARSTKRPRVVVANADDEQGARYLALPVEFAIPFSLGAQAYSCDTHLGRFTLEGEVVLVNLPGEFSIKNALAASKVALAFGIGLDEIKKGIASVHHIPGRLQEVAGGPGFTTIIDYALTPNALEALYKMYGTQKKICVFGSAGGGRDKWKRPELGRIAEHYCESIILTNDIAYDESPVEIVNDIRHGMKTSPEVILDRRAAIRRAMEIAASKARAHTDQEYVVLVTGMGIDTEITDEKGRTVPWNEVDVVREELHALPRSEPL